MAGEDQPPLPDTLEDHGITGTVVIVPMLHRLLARLRQRSFDLDALRALVVTGSAASPNLLATAVELLGPRLWQGYGQAESGMISLLTPELIREHGELALESVGRPLPEVEIEVRDDGEICVRSPHMMAGYWGEPELTGEVIDAGGWLHTRDIGRVDETGLLQLTGRSRDVILVNAEVCYAAPIERALARHPAVGAALVVGVPDARTGEAIHAFLVPAGEHPLPDADTLRALVRAELTPGHVPRTYTAITEIPVAASGKPDKQALTRRALAEQSAAG
jgi:fatty-acyl-CoA synthase